MPAGSSLTRRIVTAEPVVYTSYGPGFVGKSISIEKFLQERIAREAFDGPLTDYEYTDNEDNCELPLRHQAAGASYHLPPAQCAPLNSSQPSLSKQKDKIRSARRRRVKRELIQSREKTSLKAVSKKRRAEATKDALKLHFDVGPDVEVTRPGWIGKRVDDLPKREFTKEELLSKHGMEYFDWDGRTTHLLLDKEHRVIGVLVGRPRNSKDWDNVHNGALAALETAAAKMTFTDKEKTHRRGSFPAIPHGISFGGGQEEPRLLSHGSKAKDEALDGLMQEHHVQCICSFASRAFETYGKRNFDYMKETMEALRASRDNERNEKLKLRKPYDNKVGVFPCRSFNLGKQSTSFPHLDEGNLAQSWCSITPLGRFNPQLGGHIVLWDFGLVIVFPAGSTILIPSALIIHSNTSIRPGETRYSIIQYASGGLYRWVENGFMSEKDWLSQASEEDLQKHLKEQDSRWLKAVTMFTAIDELLGQSGEPESAELNDEGLL